MRRPDVTLRILGTSNTLEEAVQNQVSSDLDICFAFTILPLLDAQRVAAMSPQSFDIFDHSLHVVELVWPTESLRPIELHRIHHWDEVEIPGQIQRRNPNFDVETGTVLKRGLYIDSYGMLSSHQTDHICMLPVTCSIESFAYRTDDLAPETADFSESWGWLLDSAWKGRVALHEDPVIGAIDAALAVQSAGLGDFQELNNLSVDEIDHLVEILIANKRKGQFRAFPSTVAQSAELMISGKVRIQSLQAPATVLLRRAGIDFREANPREGYRASCHGVSISRCATGAVLDAAYEYLNWWLSGRPAPIISRQGRYSSNPERARSGMSTAEWQYWYGGQAAAEDLPDPDGELLIKKGTVRDGGSYIERMGRITVLDAIMDEHNYLVRRWSEFLRA